MATYNCSDNINNAYGAGGFGTCQTGQSVGAPNTGVFEQVMSGGSFALLLPLVAAIAIIGIAGILVGRVSVHRRRNR
jgi:hypothetical protein